MTENGSQASSRKIGSFPWACLPLGRVGVVYAESARPRSSRQPGGPQSLVERLGILGLSLSLSPWHPVDSFLVPNAVNRRSSPPSIVPPQHPPSTRPTLLRKLWPKIIGDSGRRSSARPTNPKPFEPWPRFWPTGRAGLLSRIWNARTLRCVSRFWTA
jgi:hypothetical protein